MDREILDFESSNLGEREGAGERRKDYSRKSQTSRGRTTNRSVHKSAGGIHRRRRKSYGL
jgi:hypothetical protein